MQKTKLANTNDLFIWIYTSKKKPPEIPEMDNRWLCEKYTPKKPIEGMNYDWMDYYPPDDGFPPKEKKLKFPNELFFIVQKQKELVFDYFWYYENILIVSDEFLNFLRNQALDEHFEIANLKIFHKNDLPLKVKSKYYAIRVGKFDDHKFEYDEKSVVRSGRRKDSAPLYPNLKLINDKEESGLFFIYNFCYRGFPIFTEKVRKEILEKFFAPEIYTLNEYPAVYKKHFSF